jgi:hypothetical protein
VDANSIRGTPLQAQVTEDAFVLILSDYPGQSVSSLEDADRAHRYAGRARLPLPAATIIHPNGNEQAHLVCQLVNSSIRQVVD